MKILKNLGNIFELKTCSKLMPYKVIIFLINCLEK